MNEKTLTNNKFYQPLPTVNPDRDSNVGCKGLVGDGSSFCQTGPIEPTRDTDGVTTFIGLSSNSIRGRGDLAETASTAEYTKIQFFMVMPKDVAEFDVRFDLFDAGITNITSSWLNHISYFPDRCSFDNSYNELDDHSIVCLYSPPTGGETYDERVVQDFTFKSGGWKQACDHKYTRVTLYTIAPAQFSTFTAHMTGWRSCSTGTEYGYGNNAGSQTIGLVFD